MEKVVTLDMLERAKRVRSARKFAGVSLQQMDTRHDIPLSTLRGWERPGTLKNQGLTLKGAHRLVKALLNEGIGCSVEWLMEGTGEGPHYLDLPKDSPKNRKGASPWSQQLAIQSEIKFFEEINPDSIVVMITDDGLAPVFGLGDFVGGIKKFGKEMTKAIDQYCIVETASKDLLVRKVIPGKKPKTYSLHCTNPQTRALNSTKIDIALKWVAPIVWHRKNQSS